MANWIVVALALATFGLAQQPPPPQPTDQPADSKPAKKNSVIVRGCVEGSTLTHTDSQEYVARLPTSLRLNGNRAIRGMLKEMNGHQIEVTGTLKGLGTTQHAGALVKDTGKTKIYVGVADRRTPEQRMMDTPSQSTIDVDEVKDIAPACVER